MPSFKCTCVMSSLLEFSTFECDVLFLEYFPTHKLLEIVNIEDILEDHRVWPCVTKVINLGLLVGVFWIRFNSRPIHKYGLIELVPT
jgi:hypothetical protein